MAKYFNPKKLISFLILFLLITWFFNGEFRILFLRTINSFSSNVKVENLKPIIYFSDSAELETSLTYKVKEGLKLDNSKSFVELFGSASTYSNTPNTQLDFFNYGESLDIIYFDDDRIKVDGDKIQFINDKKVIDVTTIMFRVHLETTTGESTEYAHLTTLHSDWLGLFFGRYSYFLQYFIWYIAIFGTAARGITWSTVYNSKTKKPVNRAIVRIMKDGTLLDTYVTGPTGAIPLRLPAGTYKFFASKSNYKFPSKLSPLSSDGEYRQLYYGKEIKLNKVSNRMKFNIPMDPLDEEGKTSLNNNLVLFASSFTDSFNKPLIVFMAVVQIISWPTYLEAWVTGLMGVSLLVIQYALQSYTTKNPGVVLKADGTPLVGVKIDIYDAQWNSFVTTTMTDPQGNYEFVLPQNDYKIKIDSPDYALPGQVEEILVTGGRKSQLLRRNVYINNKITVEPKIVAQPAVETVSK